MMMPRWSPWYVDPKFVENEEARQAVVAHARELFRLRRIAPSHLRRFMRKLHGFVLALAIFTVITLGTRRLVDWAILVLLAAVLSLLVIYWLHYRERRPFLIRALREHGDERCVACGHPLRGLPRKIIFCPECGAVRVFEIRDDALKPTRLKSEAP